MDRILPLLRCYNVAMYCVHNNKYFHSQGDVGVTNRQEQLDIKNAAGYISGVPEPRDNYSGAKKDKEINKKYSSKIRIYLDFLF